MIRLERFSEPFSKTGNIAADGFRRLLGCPTQGLLQTALRESIQNSIDAARLGYGPSLLVRYRTLTAAQCASLRESILVDLPEGDQTRNEIAVSLGKSALKVLEICDFSSTGLGGPSSADVVPTGDETLDFVNFMRNVGVARDTHHGGGTYGYGKTSLYAMSSCSTILVDTQTVYEGRPVRRFMGCHLGSAFDADVAYQGRKRFTGRHWWGCCDGDEGIDPLTGNDASVAAMSLGLPVRDPALTGTSVLILDPQIYDDNEDRPVAHEILETILWSFWPRLTASTPEQKKLSIRVEIEGIDFPVPTPETFPPLDLFASAMEAYREGRITETIRCERPKQDLGAVVISKGLCATRIGPASDECSIIPGQACHIALMRPVELVVKYIQGEPFHDSRFEWGGVFVCSSEDEVEEAFAMAEPPAHDDWIPSMLPSRSSKTFVRVALRRLEALANSYATPLTAPTTGGSERGPSLAGTAARLGRMLDSASGKGPGRPKSPSRTQSRKKFRSISPVRFIRLELDSENRRCAIFEADLQNDEADSSLELYAESHLVADGAVADGSDLPASFKTKVIGMYLDATEASTLGATLKVGTGSGVVRINVLSPPDAAIGLRLYFLSGGEE
ncbi:hypothetical protein [Pseudomonas kilonensis]|uniref:hypothetical protein n=1 Tax=Pseudomonas kilonensis TaxID=132476 RepID=UPI000AD9A52E|nr:hypothetical protein [Pseudomonas kilonensis]